MADESPKVAFGLSQLNNPTPKTWGKISTSLRYFLVGVIGLVSSTDIISPAKGKIVVLIMSGTILLLKSIDMGLGVPPEQQS